MLKNITWASGLAAGLLLVLTFWLPVEESAEFAVTLYVIYLAGFFFVRNFYNETLEQNTLSVIAGIILMSAGTYAMTLLKIPYTTAAMLILAGIIIAASALWGQLRKRKTRGASRRKPR